MASFLNIPRDVTDPHYRYRMHSIISKVEGKGNGIKTVVVNLSTIATDLDRAPEYIIKYFEIEFGTQTNIEGDKYLVNGQHTTEKLAQVLDGFINKFILCRHCRNPETSVVSSLTIPKALDLRCAACGKRTPLDMKSKLSAFMYKNPKDSAGETTSFLNLVDDGLIGKPEKSSKKSSKSSTKKSSSKKSTKRDDENGDDSASGALSKLDITDQDPFEVLKEFYATSPSDDEFDEELTKVHEAFSMRSYVINKLAVEVASDKTCKGVVELVKNKAPLLQIISKRKEGKLGILLALEGICNEDETLLKSLVGILQNLYNQDILSEESILRWHSTKAKSVKVKEICLPFIDWLNNAEEEEEDEENDDDEEDNE